MKRCLLVLLPWLCSGQILTSSFGGNIQNALASMGTKGGQLTVNRDYSSAATLVIPSNTTITCLPNITVTQTASNRDVFAFQPGSTRNTLAGCRTAGGNNAVAGYNLNFFVVAGNTFTGWHRNGITFGANSFNGNVRDNTIMQGAQNCGDAIFMEDIGSTMNIEGNVIDSAGCARDGTSGAHGIAVHTFMPGGQILRLTVRNNLINHYGTNFPIEIGKFGMGGMGEGCVISGNHILVSMQGNGGISMSGARCSVTDNDINLNGFQPFIAGIEIVNSINTTVTGNHVWKSAGASIALVIDASEGTLATTNELYGMVILVNSGTAPGITRLSRNTVANNVIIASGRAVWLQCNVVGCDARQNSISFNTMTGSGPQAVYLENDNGTVDGTQVLKNRANGFLIMLGEGNGVTNTDQ